MDVLHDSPFSATLDPILDKDGAEARVAVLKGTFDIQRDGTVTIADEQEQIAAVDEFVGEPGASSVSYESDGAYFKPATDIIVVGTAYVPKGRATTTIEASLSVGRRSKVVTVTGNRYWSYSSLLGIRMSDPEPFIEMPLSWERAFGGTDTFDSNPKKHAFEPRNPIGTGFRVTKSVESLDGLALPNIEAPKQRVHSWSDKPTPQGFGFIGRSWMPRIRYAGTYDESWEKTRKPLLPTDFQYAFFNAAPTELVSTEYLNGGEVVKAVNMTPDGVETFNVPCARVLFQGYAKNTRFEQIAPLDTVVIKLDSRKLILVWRTKYAVSLSESADVVNAKVEFIN